MFGVDVSGNQPADVLSMIPYDFAIVKATGNPNTNGYAWNYVNPKMQQQADEALARTGCLGLYCFAYGIDAVTEADFFVDTMKEYIGLAIPFLDYEMPFSNKNNREWCRTFVRRVKERTGSTVGIYASSSVINSQNLVALAQEEGCLIWSANYYLGNRVVTGYDTSGMKMAVNDSNLWQFTSTGRLNGYDKNLDLDTAYMTPGQWKAHAAGTGVNLARAVQMYTHNSTEAQLFKIHKVADMTYKFVNLRFELALDVQNAGTTPGTPVWAYTENDTPAQLWKLIPKPGDYEPEYARPLEIAPMTNPELRLDVKDADFQNGAQLQLHTRNGHSAQEWYALDQRDGIWMLLNNGYGNKLAIDLPW